MPLELFEYQKIGASFLASKKLALLADKQRLGKSAQSIRAAETINAENILVICRAVARSNWRNEFEKFSHRKRIYDVNFGRTTSLDRQSKKTTIVSYEGVKSIVDLLSTCGDKGGKFFDLVICDESHYLKNLEAKRCQLILGKNGIARFTKRLWLLTGTPTPNHAGEIWTTAYTFGATELKYQDFIERYCVVRKTGFGVHISGTNNEPKKINELRAILKKFMLRRTEKDVEIELPKMSYNTVYVDPGKVHLAASRVFAKYVMPNDTTEVLAKIIEKELGVLNGILEDGSASNELIEVLKARSSSISTLRAYTGLQKVEPACQMITEELESNAYHKVVIFAHHVDVIKMAQAHLKQFTPATLWGGTPAEKRDLLIRRFQNPKSKVRVFIGQISAAGTSIELSIANHIYFLEESFTPGDNAQAAMRCGGPNQKNPIFVRTVVLNNSIDQRVQKILSEKTKSLLELYDEKPKSIEDLF